MGDNQTMPQHAAPGGQLRQLDWMVGTWRLSGGAEGTIRFEWLDGRFFLLQHVDLVNAGHRVKGVEMIGHERPFGGEPGEEIKSRFYDAEGNTLDDVDEPDGDVVTIWGGYKGSPAYCTARRSGDGNTMTTTWVWPGGGYEVVGTRVGWPPRRGGRAAPGRASLAHRAGPTAVDGGGATG